MKKKICEFFAANPMSSHMRCASTLNEDVLMILRLIHELEKEGYLKCNILSMGNEIEPDNSHFYSLRKAYIVDRGV